MDCRSNRTWGDEVAAACCPLFVPGCCSLVPDEIASEFNVDLAEGRISTRHLMPLSEELRVGRRRHVTR